MVFLGLIILVSAQRVDPYPFAVPFLSQSRQGCKQVFSNQSRQTAELYLFSKAWIAPYVG